MHAAIAAQKKATRSPETDLSAAPPKPVQPPRERHPNDKLTAHQRGRAQVARGRLPDGAEFRQRYDDAAVRWSGTLALTDPAGRAVVFEADSKSAWRLLEKLDDLYRAYLATQNTTAEAKIGSE